MSIGTIEITVSPLGASKIETRGFAGESCRQASRFVEAALGTAIKETLTGEYFSGNVQASQTQTRLGDSQA